MWSQWYHEYWVADFPRLIIRYEDMLLHADYVMRKILECAGVQPAEDRFVYHLTPSKKHGKPVDFVSAIFKNTQVQSRYNYMTSADIQYARQHLDAELMDAFHYPHVWPLPSLPNTTQKDDNLTSVEELDS
jgi:hypothetical protein